MLQPEAIRAKLEVLLPEVARGTRAVRFKRVARLAPVEAPALPAVVQRPADERKLAVRVLTREA